MRRYDHVLDFGQVYVEGMRTGQVAPFFDLLGPQSGFEVLGLAVRKPHASDTLIRSGVSLRSFS